MNRKSSLDAYGEGEWTDKVGQRAREKKLTGTEKEAEGGKEVNEMNRRRLSFKRERGKQCIRGYREGGCQSM